MDVTQPSLEVAFARTRRMLGMIDVLAADLTRCASLTAGNAAEGVPGPR
jgi:hypothetical protein